MRILKGLSALIVLTGLVIGLPLLFVSIGANPLPGLADLPQLIGRPDYGGLVLTGTVMPLIGWIAWAWFTLSVLVEIPAAVRGVRAPRIRALSGAQGAASLLVAAVIAMGASPAMAATAPASPAPTITSTAVAGDVTQNDADDEETEAGLETYTVKSGDSLWAIAEARLGDGAEYRAIADLNYDRVQPDGRALTPADHTIVPGWELLLPETATAPGGDESTHTVRAGENLSMIADQHLGDTDRYTEILAANPGLTDPDLIHPGDTLTLPSTADRGPEHAEPTKIDEAAPQKKATDAPEAETTSSANDAAASEASPSPAWAAVESSDGAAADAASDSGVEATAGAGVDTSSAEEPAPSAGDETPGDHEEETSAEDGSVLRTAGGIGALLAAGLLGLLGVRRLHQRRRRKAGQNTPAPSTEAAVVESRLREAAGPLTADGIDHALRHISHWAQCTGQDLPEMFCARADSTTLAVYLTAPAQLPEPFTAVDDDQVVWQVNPEDLGELEPTPPAPYPGLVTLGQDHDGAHVLADIEYLGALSVHDDTGRSHEILNAMAVELGMSPWSEQLQVSLVGLAAGLPQVAGGGRIRHFDTVEMLLTRLRGQAEEARAYLHGAELESLHQARTAGTGYETMPPEIVVLAIQPTDEQLDELTDLINELPRVGIAAITDQQPLGEWSLNVDSSNNATLEPASLSLAPQRVSDQEHAAIVELLATAGDNAAPAVDTEESTTEITLDLVDTTGGFHPTLVADPDPDPADDDTAEPAEPVTNGPAETDNVEATETDDAAAEHVNEEPLEESSPEPATAKLPAPAASDHDQTEPAGDDQSTHETEEEAAPAATDEPLVAAVPAGEPLLEAVDEETGAPFIRILGPVVLDGARGPAPTTPSGDVSPTKIARYTSTAAFLALNPGSSLEQFHHAFWPNADPRGSKADLNRNRLSSDVRKYLGQDEGGAYYYPHAVHGEYRLDERVGTDWQLFCDLVGSTPRAATTERLVAALKLVRGAPFEGVAAKHYLWIDTIVSEMIDRICDVAHELVQRSVKNSAPALARLGATAGCLVDPANEQMWRNAMMAEHLAGDRRGVEAVARKLNDYLDSFGDDYEPEEETQDLLEQLRSRHGYQIAG